MPESFNHGRSISSAGNATVGMNPYNRGLHSVKNNVSGQKGQFGNWAPLSSKVHILSP